MGRVDISRYFNGCSVLENFIVHPHGGATRRPGTRFILETVDSTKQCILIPFIWSEEQAYIIEIGDQYMRFFYDQGYLEGPDGIELVTNGSFANDTSWTKGTGWTISGGAANCDGSQTSTSDLYQSITLTSGESYKVVYTVSDRTAGTVTPMVGGTAGTAVSANGTYRETIVAGSDGKITFRADADFTGKIDDVSVQKIGALKISSPYTESQLAYLRFAQSADVLHIAHPNVQPYKLIRYDHDHWELSAISFTSMPAQWTGTNYPGVVGFFEQRLWWGATPSQPQTLWGSVSGSYYDMTTGTADDNALVYTIASNRVDKIRWIEPYRRLLIGTLGSEWSAGASSSLDPITPTNVRFERENTFGSANIQGKLINTSLIFVGKHGYPLRHLTYDYANDSFRGQDLSLLSGHLVEEGIAGFDYQQDPDSIIWMVRNDGVLLGCTFYPAEEVISWHKHILGGDGLVESVAVIPGLYGHDEVWLVVKRTIGGNIKRYIEMMEGDFGEDIEDAFYVDSGLSYDGGYAVEITGITKANPAVVSAPGHTFEDGDKVRIWAVEGMTEINIGKGEAYTVTGVVSGVSFQLSGVNSSSYSSYTGGGYARKVVNTISGLDHLEGEKVQVLVDGAVHPDMTVASGSITLQWYGSKIHVGLGYNSRLQTVRLEAGSSDGTAQAKKQRIHSAAIRFYKTVGGSIGVDDTALDTIPFRSTGDPMDEPVPLFSGDKVIKMPGGYNREGKIWVTQEQPLPMSVLAIMPQLVVNDQ